MSMQLALIGDEGLWVAITAIAAWMVLTCLRCVASEIEYRIRRHNLQVEVRMLRQRQVERMRAINDYTM